MPYWIRRILLKSGELVTEKELRRDEYYCEGIAPVVGEVLTVHCRGRTFRAEVVWGNWPGRGHSADMVVPLRVKEI